MIRTLIFIGVLFLLQSASLAQAKKPSRFDNLGNAIDAHDGEIVLFDGTYYLYGTSYGCGFEWGNKGAPFCGFKVYSSKDLQVWREEGNLFDASTSIWQTRCNGATYGCFRPHVVYNQKTKLYVLWINVYDNVVGYRVFTATTPVGPFSEQPEPKLAVNSNMPVAGLNNGDHDTFVDDDGTGYLAYTDWRKGGAIVIEKLRDDYLSGSGQYVSAVTNGNTEAPALFKRKGKYYLLYSDPNCGYCAGTGTAYKTADHPLGPWIGGTRISENSCGGQPSFVSVLKLGRDTLFLYGSDLWNNGAKNEALANYYWTGLTFDGMGAIKPLVCSDNYGFVERDSIALTPITALQGYQQEYIPSGNGYLRKIGFTVARANADSALVVTVYDAGRSVFTKVISPLDVSWSARRVVIPVSLPVKKKGRYVCRISTLSTKGEYKLVGRNPGALIEML